MDIIRKVYLSETNSADRVIAQTLSDAFHEDPAFSWIIPDPAQRRLVFPKLFHILLRSDRKSGFVLAPPNGEVATLWRGPGKAHTPIGEIITEAVPLLAALGFSLGRALALSDAIESHHPRDKKYWYLHIAGVSPHHQGKGWGGIAIRTGLARAAAQGLPVLLETATPSNLPLYQRMGFVVTQEWEAPKGGPHFWTMERNIA